MHSPSAGLFYIFCDEKYLDIEEKRRFVTTYIGVPQRAWNRLKPEYRNLSEPYGMPRLSRIENLLEKTEGASLIAYADANLEYLIKGSRDWTDDIPDMARSDNIWSVVLAFGLSALLSLLHNHGLHVKNADIYYDTKNLKVEHRSAIRNVMKSTLPEEIRKAGRISGAYSKYRPKIRRFEEISKTLEYQVPDKYQAGIIASHYLAQETPKLIGTAGKQRIHVKDNTIHLSNYISYF